MSTNAIMVAKAGANVDADLATLDQLAFTTDPGIAIIPKLIFGQGSFPIVGDGGGGNGYEAPRTIYTPSPARILCAFVFMEQRPGNNTRYLLDGVMGSDTPFTLDVSSSVIQIINTDLSVTNFIGQSYAFSYYIMLDEATGT